MNLQSLVRLFSKISLVFTFVVIIAGSVVRMTGSGMGCPDWPKCFGYMIPPTDIEALTYAEGKAFSKGQMVILNDTLWVAQESFIAEPTFNKQHWSNYTKHDYAHFNPVHTWIEYVNRLATVLFGIPVVILVVLSILYYFKSKDGITLLLALGTLFMLGFEAWLGKMVVDGNLHEGSITWHMIGSMAIVLLLLLLVYRHREKKEAQVIKPTYSYALWAMLLLTIIQIILGTQVREEIDVIARNIDDRSMWIDALSTNFLVHRSFSIVVFLLTIYLVTQNKKFYNIQSVQIIGWLIALEILAGVVLAYAAMPAFAQPIHLWLGIVLFAYVIYALLITRKGHVAVV
jgi:cytochrome c oxidase assembly protein subunit 15